MKERLFLFAILAVSIFSNCTHKNELDNQAASTDNSDKYPVTSPAIVDTTYYSEYVAEIQSQQNVEIRARTKGFIQSIQTDEGKTVRQGQVLFTLNNQEFKQEIAKAQSILRQARAEAAALELEIQNTQLLADKKIVGKTQVDMAVARLEVLKARIEEAQSDEAAAKISLSYTEIRAPFDGIVSRIPNKAGSLVEEGTLLTTVSNNQSVFAYFNVSEREYLDFIRKNGSREKETVSLLLADGEAYGYKGQIENIDGQFDKNTGNIAMRARFPNPKQLLRHGASGKISLPNVLKNALVIPQKATFELQDRTCVYVVDENGTVQIRNIVPKLRLPDLFVVESGLSASDRIIYEGIQTAREGEKVNIEFTPLSSLLTALPKG